MSLSFYPSTYPVDSEGIGACPISLVRRLQRQQSDQYGRRGREVSELDEAVDSIRVSLAPRMDRATRAAAAVSVASGRQVGAIVFYHFAQSKSALLRILFSSGVMLTLLLLDLLAGPLSATNGTSCVWDFLENHGQRSYLAITD